jgi:hypothetical protein
LRPRRQPLPRFETGIEVAEGFAQALGGDEASFEEPLTALTQQILDLGRRLGCPLLRVYGAAAGRSKATLWLRVDADAALIQRVAEASATEASAVSLSRLPGGLLRWDQAWSTVRPRAIEADRDPRSVQLFPLGLSADRRVLYGERTAGAMLVAGLPSAGVHQLLGALVVDRLRRQPPSQLVVLTIASRDRLDPTLAAAPQQRMGFVDPADRDLVGRVLTELGDQLRERLDHPECTRPDVLLVVDEWSDLPDAGATVDLLAEHGVAAGINLLAATTRVQDPRIETWARLFRTRLVLQTPDAPASVRLLGQPGAEELDRIGQAVPYLDGAVLARVRGFCVPPVYVQDLVARMRAQVDAEARPALFEHGAQVEPLTEVNDRESAAEEDGMLEGDVLPEARAPASDAKDDDGPEPSETYEQAPLVRVVSMPASRGPGAGTRPAPDTAQPLPVTAEFLGHDRILVGGSELTATDGVSWDLFRIVACLPPGQASLARVAALMYPSDADVDQKAAIQRLRQNKSNLQKAWMRVVTQEQARRLLTLQNGVLAVDEELVAIDVQAFLAGMHRAHRARAARLIDASIAAYRQARELYSGPLLAGRDEDYEWLTVPIEGRLTLREALRHQERLATSRLAELLVAAAQPAEAATLYAELMRDPGPPDVEADELEQFVHRQYAFREECARAVFECCRLTGDLPTLTRTYQELREVLRALALDAGLDVSEVDTDATAPSTSTRALYEEVRAGLMRGGSIASD